MQTVWDALWRNKQRAVDKHTSLYGWGEEAFRSFVRWADPSQFRILEAGCGSGRFSLAFGRRYPQSRVFGVDASEAAIGLATEAARLQGLENVSFHRAVVEQLPFEDGFFDLVFSEGVLEHVADLPGVLREIMRVTRPGGYILTAVPNTLCVSHTLYKRWKGSAYEYHPERSFTRGELARLYRAVGLEIVGFHGFGTGFGMQRLKRRIPFGRIVSAAGTLWSTIATQVLDPLTNHMISDWFGFEITIAGRKPEIAR